ncbi:MAG: hypothetical protein IJT87_01530 [Ruminiclostridium sp.]|nr:hypothetical protein [Ruminiclostridium sp.]
MITILLTGGDMRTVYAAKALSGQYRCLLYGFGKLDENGRLGIPLYGGNETADCLLLPVNRSGNVIKCPFGSKAELDIGELPRLRENGIIIEGSRTPETAAYCEQNGYAHCAVFEREELAVANAQLTAEGALAAAINGTETSIHGSAVLILGFGRIAKLCARYFAALGANVTVAARKTADLAWAEALGCGAADITDNGAFDSALRGCDIILNTVPAPILAGRRAAAITPDTVLIELASVPCTDESVRFRVIKANGLPGKTAPAAAGHRIAETVRNILNERGR